MAIFLGARASTCSSHSSSSSRLAFSACSAAAATKQAATHRCAYRSKEPQQDPQFFRYLPSLIVQSSSKEEVDTSWNHIIKSDN